MVGIYNRLSLQPRQPLRQIITSIADHLKSLHQGFGDVVESSPGLFNCCDLAMIMRSQFFIHQDARSRSRTPDRQPVQTPDRRPVKTSTACRSLDFFTAGDRTVALRLQANIAARRSQLFLKICTGWFVAVLVQDAFLWSPDSRAIIDDVAHPCRRGQPALHLIVLVHLLISCD